MQINKEKVRQKFIIGIELRTSNQKDRAEKEIPAHWNRFFNEQISDKIPNKLNDSIFSLYTDYEGDFTKPYSCIIGYEVSDLNDIPLGLVGKVIPESEYALFSVQQKYLESQTKIQIHYLPPYSPNLNAIERLWKVMRECTTYNKVYPMEAMNEKFLDFYR